MKRSSHRPLVAVLCAMACAMTAIVSLWPDGGRVRTEDQNGDGRPDVWRVYDRDRQLSERSVDTNFDGRSDVHEYYEHGTLRRRESDRDFNDRIDLVQDYDVATGQHSRSTIDVDLDGTADLLVLFQDGHPVYEKWARPMPAAGLGLTGGAGARTRAAGSQLAPLADPFLADLAIRAASGDTSLGDEAGLAATGGLPVDAADIATPHVLASAAPAPGHSNPSSFVVDPRAPRGPPPSLLLG